PRAGLDRWVNPYRPCGAGAGSGGSAPGLAAALDDELQGGELPQPHRAASVQLLRGDADLGAEAELLAVHEAGGGVDEDRGGVDLLREAAGRPQVGGDDGLAVAAAVAGDVGDGGVERVDDPHGQLQVEELGGVVLV